MFQCFLEVSRNETTPQQMTLRAQTKSASDGAGEHGRSMSLVSHIVTSRWSQKFCPQRPETRAQQPVASPRTHRYSFRCPSTPLLAAYKALSAMGLSGRKTKQRIPNDPRNLAWANGALSVPVFHFHSAFFRALFPTHDLIHVTRRAP